MKLKKVKTIILILICLMAMGSSAVYGVRYTCNVAYPYQWEKGLYCSEPGAKLGWKLDYNNWRSTYIDYYMQSYGTRSIEASTGYAYYVASVDSSIGLIDSDMQSVIWESDRWGNPSNVKDNTTKASVTKGKLYQRASQYGNAYYGILSYSIYNKVPIFKTTTKEKDLKVLVDRTGGTYTVGPYKLTLNTKNNTYKKEGAKSLYKELKKSGNEGYNAKNAFAKFDINSDLTGINGNNFKLVNSNGKEINFPNFVPGEEEEFYIKFTPNNNGAITETGTPTIKINFLNGSKFRGELIKGKAYNATWTPGVGTKTDESGPGNPGGTIPQEMPIDFTKGKILKADKVGQWVDEGPTTYTVIWDEVSDTTGEVIETHKKEIGAKGKVNYIYDVRAEMDLPVGVNSENIEVAQYFTVQLKDSIEKSYGTTENVTVYSKSDFDSYDKFTEDDFKEKYMESGEYPTELTWGMIESRGGGSFIKLWMDDVSISLSENQFNADSINGWIDEYSDKTHNFFDRMGWTYDEEFDTTIDGTDFSNFGSDYYESIKSGSTPDYKSSYNVNQSSSAAEKLQTIVKVKDNKVTSTWNNSSAELPGAPIDMQIGGTVWLEKVSSTSDGKYTSGDSPFAGIQVKLYESNGTLAATTLTDSNGKYRFYGKVSNGVALINALKQYYVTFEYDGQRYQATYYKNDVANHGTNPTSYSNARETDRGTYNAKFKEISSSPQNYETTKYGTNTKGWYRAYGVDHKIVDNYGNYVPTGAKNENNQEIALTYEDVYNKFLEICTSSSVGNPANGDNNRQWSNKTYWNIINSTHKTKGLKGWLKEKGVTNEFDSIANFIMDSLVESSTQKNQSDTPVLYPKYSRFVLKNSYKTHITSNEYKRKTTPTVKVGSTFTYLYSVNYDYGRYAGFGVESRKIKSDISLQKDVFKTTLIINGKMQEYTYAKRDVGKGSGTWDSRGRVASGLDNGTTKYTRNIRASDYLFNARDYGDSDLKNLQAYVTYRIAVKNNGNVNVKINEIVDYYDADEYENPVNTDVQLVKDKTYIGDSEGNPIKDLTVSSTGLKRRTRSGSNKLVTSEHTKTKGYNYNEVYLTGMTDTLTDGGIMYVYLTFKVKNETEGKSTGKIRLDYADDPYTNSNPSISIGKRNIAEINDYETIYPNGSKIPNYIDGNGNLKDTTVANGITPGLVDADSNPGSLNNLDLDDNGMIKFKGDDEKITKVINGKKGLTVNDRQEDDTSQSPNMIFKIKYDGDDPDGPDGSDDPDDKNNSDFTRKLKGFIFEDIRENESDETGGAAIGNGNSDNGETKINGVTLELVELVPAALNEYQLPTGDYEKERIWGSYKYNDNNQLESVGTDRYASGDGHSKIIINGTGVFAVKDNEGLQDEDGAYTFKSFPAGDFFVRFKYGDTDDTVMLNTDYLKERYAELLGIDLSQTKKEQEEELSRKVNAESQNQSGLTSEEKEQILELTNTLLVNTITEKSGRNAKSYNGQDYKSTVYQKGIAQDGDYGSYNSINGFIRYGDTSGESGQNYKVTGLNEYAVDDKSQMYYYNIAKGDTSATVSDAKDVWYYRERSNDYSKGKDGILLNRRAETLASFYKLASFAPEKYEVKDTGEGDYYTYEDGAKIYDYSKSYYAEQQKAMINALEENTFIVAQTGVINGQIEYNRSGSTYQETSLGYTINNLNLGLTERPKAQLKLNKEVANYNLTLQNGQVIFDAQKSVNNLAYSGHVQHYVKKENGLIPRYIEENELNPRLGRAGNGNNELIQNYVDNEMLSQATVNVIYKLTVENVGETDYTDKKFYYTGNEDDRINNISTTEAVKLVDYVANQIKFEQIAQDNNQWYVTSAEELTPVKEVDGEADIEKEKGNYVNRLYYPELQTYSTIIATESGLNGALKPGEKKETTLSLSTQTQGGMENSNLTYNNMAEIVATSNSNGRRCAFSIPGNEEMSDQSLGNNAAKYAKSSIDRLQVREVDADSAQKIILMPPTGIFGKK